MFENIAQLYRFRALVSALVSRQVATRYRGSALGFLWTLLNPLCLMLVYTLVFRYYLKFNSVPNYSLFLFCGLLPWIWVTSALPEGTAALVSSGHLITKSMFPAQVLPLVSVITTLINFLLSLPILFLFMLIAGVPFHLSLIAVPLLFVAQFIMLTGLTFALSAINVRYRDVQHLVANALTFLFFLCPIVYPASAVPERFRFTMDLNPFALLTSSYQKAIMEGEFPALSKMVYLAAASLVCFIIGNLLFNRCRESFAELL